MRLSDVIKIILIVIFGVFFIDYDLSYDEDKTNAYLAMNDHSSKVITLDENIITKDNDSFEDTFYYANEGNPVLLNNENIMIECYGTSKDDAKLVEEHLKLDVSFETDNELLDSILLKSDEDTIIHIKKYYDGLEYPHEDVKCNYRLIA